MKNTMQKTAKEILHIEKNWKKAFAKYPFGMSHEFVILKAMEEYAKQEREKGFTDGYNDVETT